MERISELYLIPALQQLFDILPFEIAGFHSDNVSEYVNHRVAELLEKLRIEITKSQARRSNDNALVKMQEWSCVAETARTRTHSPAVCGDAERVPSTASEPVCELLPAVPVCISGA